MTQLYTPECEGGFEEITLDVNHSLEQEIQALLKKVEQKSDEEEVQRQLELFKSDGLIETYEGDKNYSIEGGS